MSNNYELNKMNCELYKVSAVPCQPQSLLADADEMEQPRSISLHEEDDEDDDDWDDDDDDD